MHGLILFAYFPPKGGSEDLSQHCCLCRADGRQLWALTHTLENGRKISGQDVPKDATRCNTLLDLLVLLQYIPRSWLGDWHRPLDNICWYFLQWSSTCEYQKHIENGLLTSPKIKKALIMIDPYQSNQIHQIHGCLWHELLQCFLREPWRPDHTITSEGNPKLDLVKREASFQSFVLLHWELKILEQFWASIHSPNKDTSWKFITQFSREICIKWLFWFIWPLFLLVLGWWLHKGSQGHLWDLGGTHSQSDNQVPDWEANRLIEHELWWFWWMFAFVACVEYGVCCSAKPCVICVTQSCARPNCDRRLLLCIQQTRHIIQRHGTVKQSFTILYIFWPWCKTMIMMRHVRDPVSFATHLFLGGVGRGACCTCLRENMIRSRAPKYPKYSSPGRPSPLWKKVEMSSPGAMNPMEALKGSSASLLRYCNYGILWQCIASCIAGSCWFSWTCEEI